MRFKNISKRFRGVIVILALGILLSAGVTFAAWSTTVWNDPSIWIKSGGVISAKNIAENFNYLYNKVTSVATASSSTTRAAPIEFGNPVPGTFIGSQKNGSRTSQCPRGSVVTGITIHGHFVGNFVRTWIVNGVQPICTKISPSIWTSVFSQNQITAVLNNATGLGAYKVLNNGLLGSNNTQICNLLKPGSKFVTHTGRFFSTFNQKVYSFSNSKLSGYTSDAKGGYWKIVPLSIFQRVLGTITCL